MPLLVNEEYIDDMLIRIEAEAISRQLLSENPAQDELSLNVRVWECARENVVNRVLLRQAALAGTEPIPANEIEADRRTQRFLAQITAEAPRPASGEIANYYRKHRDRFQHPALVHASHLVKNVDETADEAAALAQIAEAARALERGMPFAEVADRFSDCPGRGGDLGFFARGEMVEEFEAVVFALRAGEVSSIFRSPFGFHIAQLHEKRSAGIRSLREVRSQIENAILDARKQAIIGQLIARLRERANIRRVSGQT